MLADAKSQKLAAALKATMSIMEELASRERAKQKVTHCVTHHYCLCSVLLAQLFYYHGHEVVRVDANGLVDSVLDS